MNKIEFLSTAPDIINHKSSGYCELEIITDTKTSKGVCYRHRDNTASFGTYGVSWEEVSEKLRGILIKEGYLKR